MWLRWRSADGTLRVNIRKANSEKKIGNTITFIYVSMNLIRIFAKKFGDEVVIPQTETQKIDRTRGDGSDCSSGS